MWTKVHLNRFETVNYWRSYNSSAMNSISCYNNIYDDFFHRVKQQSLHFLIDCTVLDLYQVDLCGGQ